MVPPLPWVVIISYFTLSFGSSIGTILINKYLYQIMHFQRETLLMSLHQFATSCICFLLSFVDRNEFPVQLSIPKVEILKLSFVYSMSIVFANGSLYYSSVGTYQIAKLLIAPLIMLLNYILYRKKCDPKIIFCIMILTLGVFAVEMSDLTVDNWRGSLYSCLGIICNAYTQIILERMHTELNVTSFEILYYQAPMSGVILLLFSPFLEGITIISHPMSGLLDNSKFLAILLISCLVSFGTNFGTFLVIGNTSALTYQVFGHAKAVLIIVIGSALFDGEREENTNIRYLGFIFCIGGTIWYSYIKLKRSRSKILSD